MNITIILDDTLHVDEITILGDLANNNHTTAEALITQYVLQMLSDRVLSSYQQVINRVDKATLQEWLGSLSDVKKVLSDISSLLKFDEKINLQKIPK